MSATILTFPPKLDPAVSAVLAVENLEYILDRESDPSLVVCDRPPGRITGIIMILKSAITYAEDRCDASGQQLALRQASDALEIALTLTTAWLQDGSYVDCKTEMDSENAKDAVDACWNAADVAIARGHRQSAREWGDIAVTVLGKVRDRLRSAIVDTYDIHPW